MTDTIPNVPRELLENLIEQHITAHGCTTETARQAQLMLSAKSPAGVDDDYVPEGLAQAIMQSEEVDAVSLAAKSLKAAGVDGLPEFLTPELKSIGEAAVAKAVADQCYSVPVLQTVYAEAVLLSVVDDAQAIIDGLRAKVGAQRVKTCTALKDRNDARKERDAALAECERLRMQLAACGVVALANTIESAGEARQMHPDYMSASCSDVADAVDREIALRTERDQQAQRIGELEEERNYLKAFQENAQLHIEGLIRDRDAVIKTSEPIYQYGIGRGNWTDITKDAYGEYASRGGEWSVRVVYSAAMSAGKEGE